MRVVTKRNLHFCSTIPIKGNPTPLYTHTWVFSHTHQRRSVLGRSKSLRFACTALKKQLLHTVTENKVHPIVSLALHTIPKVHFSVLLESKHQKTLVRVTYFLQIRVGGILQISKNQSFCLSVSCVLYEIGQYS